MLRGHVRIEPDFKSGVGVRREGTSSDPGLVFSARLDVLGSHLVLRGKRFLRHLFLLSRTVTHKRQVGVRSRDVLLPSPPPQDWKFICGAQS